MAPREASGTFPDQFLTYDYEPSLPIGAPPVHEAFPPVAGTENEVLPPEDGGNATNAGSDNEGTGNGSDVVRSAMATASRVDPLSIDPTATAATAAAAANHGTWDAPGAPGNNANTSHLSNLQRPRLADVSIGSQYSQQTLQNVTRSASLLIPPPVPAAAAVGTMGSPPMLVSPQTSMSTLPQVTSTDSSLTGASSTGARSVGGAPLSSSFAPRPFSVRSVLDRSTSLESDEDDGPPGLDVTYDSAGSSLMNQSESWEPGQSHIVEDDQSQATPILPSSNESAVSATSSSSSLRTIQQVSAFDNMSTDEDLASQSLVSPSPGAMPTSPNSINLSFGPNTTVADLKYFAERGCIVALLQALTTPRLVTLGTRMLADYAKMSHRRVAVASNRRILEFIQQTMLQASEHSDWLGREYAVETIRSLTATEESDRYLMGTYGLLNTLALVARGGPFVAHVQPDGTRSKIPTASEKARLHACIAIMNLSCGKANKIEIAKVPDVLESMRDVMLHSSDEARLKATTCIKNLSNADANDGALLGTPGLVEALGHVAASTCSTQNGATPCTTNACLALMNLSISKANKHKVFRTAGVMDSLMTVLERTTAQGSSTEARIKACSALSNLAIGYDNKIPMFSYPGFVDAILNVIQTDTGEARTKACSILWSFAAEMKNQVPVVQRGDILPVLVQVAEEDGTTEARFKCVAALTLLAESLENAIPLLESGALAPLMDILHEAGPDPTQWKGQTASWCVGFLMNIAQSDEAVHTLREAGVVELLAPLLTLDHYQSLKAAMAVTFVCRYDEGDECYDLLRKTENVIPKIISLLHNTLSGRGGNGYKYGVFTLRSSVGCIAALASGPDFMKERIATGPVFESLLRVLSDFCVEGGTPGAIVGGGRDDVLSATLAIRATQSLTAHLIPIAGCSALPFGQSMEDRLLTALASFETAPNEDLSDEARQLAMDAKIRIQGGQKTNRSSARQFQSFGDSDVDMNDVASLASNCCGLDSLPAFGEHFLGAIALPSSDRAKQAEIVSSSSVVEDTSDSEPVRTFLLADARTGRRYAVPTDPSGGRAFNDNRVWCYRRGRFCLPGEQPDPNFVWNDELQQAYEAAIASGQEESVTATDAASAGTASASAKSR